MMSGYFHQDWMLHGSVEMVVDSAIADRTKGERMALLHEVERLLSRADDDSALKQVLNGFPHSELGFGKAKDAGEFMGLIRGKLADAVGPNDA